MRLPGSWLVQNSLNSNFPAAPDAAAPDERILFAGRPGIFGYVKKEVCGTEKENS